MPISRQTFGSTSDGTAIDRYTLTNAHGLEADILTYGGVVSALRVPDRHGVFGDIALGLATLAPYLGDHPTLARWSGAMATGSPTVASS